MTTDNARLLGDGSPVALADGSKVNVRFGAEAMMRLEDHFGGLGAFAAAVDDGTTGKAFTTALHALNIGVEGRTITAADLDTHRINEYLAAILDAWLEAMPPAGVGKEAAPTSESDGATTTTLPPSASAEAKPSGDE